MPVARRTPIEQLAWFATATSFDSLPPDVVEESKRIVLDCLGCAVAGTGEPKGEIGVEYGRLLGARGDEATIFGTAERATVFGAAFANGELINALDFDPILPPGHVSPYVLPGALAVAETLGASGRDLIVAVAVAHEMSYRIGNAMDYLRDVKDGRVTPPKVYGYSSTVFGATAAIALLQGAPREVIAEALGIAGLIPPANAFQAWAMHAPSTTIKYLMAGPMTQAALTAAHVAQLGHRGDLRVLDDREFGFPRFIRTERWEPEAIVDGLGTDWRFPKEQSFKPYPHCRILHALLDAMSEIVEQADIRPEEIDAINAWGEGWVDLPSWTNTSIEHAQDAQFSIAHGLAVGAQRLQPGPRWQSPEVVFDPAVLGLMRRVTYRAHPDYDRSVSATPSSRPSRIEVVARGRSFVAERFYPKGTPSADGSTAMTNDELVAKFDVNVGGRLSPAVASQVAGTIFELHHVADVSSLLRQLGRSEALV
jgi:2-methylcitrate dehydratase PrpD